MKLRILSVTSLLAAGLCWSCSFHTVEEDLAPADLCDPNDTTTVSFQDTIFPIVTKYCSNNANGDCHFAGATTPKPDFSTYAGIKLKVDDGRIQARLFDQNPTKMPPSFSSGPRDVSGCELILIQKWIDAGAPNN